MRRLLATGMGMVVTAWIALLPGVTASERQSPPKERPEQRDVCARGCSAVADLIGTLAQERYDELIAAYGRDPSPRRSEALETLLFHGAQARALVAAGGLDELPPEHARILRRELARERVWLEVRLVDDDGSERLSLGPIAVPLGQKQHIHPDHVVGMASPEVSGTVQRVGVEHLWARL